MVHLLYVNEEGNPGIGKKCQTLGAGLWRDTALSHSVDLLIYQKILSLIKFSINKFKDQKSRRTQLNNFINISIWL